MIDKEGCAAAREAGAASVGHQGPTPQRYRFALERYLAVVAGTEDSSARDTSARAGSRQSPLWRLADIEVRDVMTTAVISVAAGAPFKRIVETLAKSGVSAVPVVDAAGRVLGIVSESDLVARVVTGGHPAARVPPGNTGRRATRHKSEADSAHELMTAPAVTIDPNASVVHAARTAARANVRRLPVVDHAGVLVGMVTRSDLLRVFLRDDAEIRDHIIEEILARRHGLDPTNIDVSVRDGVVTLTGQLERRGTIAPLLDATRAIAGVVGVQDHLTYRIDDRLLPPPTATR